MKIGAFAKKFNSNISTVRYYVNNGLLMPEKENGQYDFGKDCIGDMEKILKYKRYQFSLEEIQLLFFMEKASHFQDEIVVQICGDILREKRNQLIEKRDHMTEFIDDLEREIEGLSVYANGIEGAVQEGVPFSYIPYLYCPVCQEPLKIDSASLSNGSIQKGALWCECGYRVSISEGIIFCKDHMEGTPFKSFDNIDSVKSMKDQFSPNYRMLIKKAYIWMYNCIASSRIEPRHILAGPFTLNFTFEYIDQLGEGNTYVIFDPSFSRIKKIRKYLSGRGFNVVYIVGSADCLPIKHKSIDVYIDDYSTVNSLFTYNDFSTNQLAPLIKPLGEVVGIFSSYRQAPKSLLNFKELHPKFDVNRMTLSGLSYDWGLNGVTLLREKTIGTTNPGEVHFLQNVMGEQVEVHGYLAKKSVRKKGMDI